MRIASLTRRLPALLFATALGSVALASAAAADVTWTTVISTPNGGQPAQATPASPTGPTAPGGATATPQQVEQKLDALKYDVGPVDGQIDEQAESAIMAFQKVNSLERTGKLTPDVAASIMATQGTPPAMVPNGEPSRIEISLARQVLFLWEGGTLTKILPVSSGRASTPTPTGEYHIYRYDPGWHTSSLGRLYNAEYFVGGYAVHGSPSVPGEPVSHGCVRIPMSAAEWFPSHVSNGMQVVILGS